MDFEKLREEFVVMEKEIGKTKGRDYTLAGEDRLFNFREVGKLVKCPHCGKGVGARAVWAVYFLKHVFAVLAWVKTGKVESEGLTSRFLDIRVYSLLGKGIEEDESHSE